MLVRSHKERLNPFLTLRFKRIRKIFEKVQIINLKKISPTIFVFGSNVGLLLKWFVGSKYKCFFWFILKSSDSVGFLIDAERVLHKKKTGMFSLFPTPLHYAAPRKFN